VVILCGGMGTRLREASEKLPKPLVDIGGKPILWHVMKIFSQHGYRRFVLCLGYKGEQIKRYFLDYREHTADFTLHLTKDTAPRFHSAVPPDEDWEVTFVETGLLTGTGARLRRVRQHLDTDHFLLTYGDGIGDVDVTALVAGHRSRGVSAPSPASIPAAGTASCRPTGTASRSSTRSRRRPRAG
jgi:glucose-1-phosphate cytidylyltransferase